ncbi:hypothetical protein BaRGS_00018959, partial [Batillaria attramentaria]
PNTMKTVLLVVCLMVAMSSATPQERSIFSSAAARDHQKIVACMSEEDLGQCIQCCNNIQFEQDPRDHKPDICRRRCGYIFGTTPPPPTTTTVV